jgi:transposase InsO family protein
MTSSIVSASFLDAFIKREQPQNLVLHSDQSVQYKSQDFQKRPNKFNVIQSFSKPGCPYDNTVIESFFSSLKKEEIYRTTYNDIGKLRYSVEKYIDFFNSYRPHSSLSYLTPEQYENYYYKKHK